MDTATVIDLSRQTLTVAITIVAPILLMGMAVGISVSLFLDPDPAQIAAAAGLPGVDAVELHTGQYAHARPGPKRDRELETLRAAGAQVRHQGFALHAGHGLTCRNVLPVAEIADMHELNIGHSIIARALMVGMQQAVREMKDLLA